MLFTVSIKSKRLNILFPHPDLNKQCLVMLILCYKICSSIALTTCLQSCAFCFLLIRQTIYRLTTCRIFVMCEIVLANILGDPYSIKLFLSLNSFFWIYSVHRQAVSSWQVIVHFPCSTGNGTPEAKDVMEHTTTSA